jgi:MFS superfamily sulfate permease-like transporter
LRPTSGALFLTPLFFNLPEATLGAIVIVAVAAMMKFAKIRSFYALRRVDFWLAMVALFGVLTFEALEGLLIAVIVSLFALVARASKPGFSLGVNGALAFSGQRHTEPAVPAWSSCDPKAYSSPMRLLRGNNAVGPPPNPP